MPFRQLARPRRFWSHGGACARSWAFELACAVVLLAAQGGAAGEEACDQACRDRGQEGLLGDWYVLIHYRDATAGQETGTDWEDQIWRVEEAGGNLRWTIFPHVELARSRGRYQEQGDGRRARSQGAWSPDAAQLEEIRAGLELDPYSARSKTLRGSAAQGWRSAGALRSESTSMLGYHELWRIVLGETGPVFSRRDSMGSARTKLLEGQTTLATDTVEDSDREMSGAFERAGRFRGRFRMIRMKSPKNSESGS